MVVAQNHPVKQIDSTREGMSDLLVKKLEVKAADSEVLPLITAEAARKKGKVRRTAPGVAPS